MIWAVFIDGCYQTSGEKMMGSKVRPGFTRCGGADFITEARLSPLLAAMKLSITVEGPLGLRGLLMWYQWKFTASPGTHLAKMLNLTLIRSLDLMSSLQETGSVEEQVKWHQEATDKPRGLSVLQDNCPSVFNASVMTKRSGGLPWWSSG